jgi:outer membrane protein
VKYSVKFFVVTLIALICTHASAEQKIAYLDMKFILNNSKAGKGAQEYLKKSFKENQKRLSNEETKLKKAESDLLAKKSLLTKEEYQTKSSELRKTVMKYQSDRRSSLEKISKLRAEARAKLIKELDPILDNYIKENSISLIVDKKNIVKGRNDLDITNLIVEKLNKQVPSLNLK